MRMKTMAQKVAAKKAMNPEATAISRLANHPRLPSGMPKTYPAAKVRGVAGAFMGEIRVMQVEYLFMVEGVGTMAEGIQSGLVQATQVARAFRLSGGRRRALQWAPPPTRQRGSGCNGRG